MSFKFVLRLIAVGLILGCTTTPDNAMSDRYENIIYEKPGLDLSEYRNIMFGRLEVDIPKQARLPDSRNVQRLRKEFRDAFFRELQQSASGLYTRFVDQNARDVLLVKPYLIGARTVTADSSALKSDSGTGSLQVDGSLTLDISLLDSLSGEVLLRAAGTRSQSRRTDSVRVDWIEVSVVADTWAKRIVAFLDEHLSK